MCRYTDLQSFAKTAEISCALFWMALMVSLLALVAPSADLSSSAVDLADTGFDCNMIVHSDSYTRLSSLSQNCTGLRGRELKGKQGQCQ